MVYSSPAPNVGIANWVWNGIDWEESPTETADNSDVTSVDSSTESVILLAANSSRKMAMIFNDSTQNLFIKFGTTASTTNFTVKLSAGSYFEFPFPIYRGRVDGIWTSANGAARVTELT